MSSDNDPMIEIRASFFVECEELLEALQDGLQALEDETGDAETINIVFRAVHSIKGGAGAFGLEALVRFAHRFETVLEEVRAGRMLPDQNAVKIFFQSGDHLSDLVRFCRDGIALSDDISASAETALNTFLQDTPEQIEEEIDFQPMELALDLDAMDVNTTYEISFSPKSELYTTGNDPVILLRNIEALGDTQIRCDYDDVPPLNELSPEGPHLSWSLSLQTTVSQAEIEEVFEFVEDICAPDIHAIDAAEHADTLEIDAPLPDPARVQVADRPVEIADQVNAASPATKPSTATQVVRVDIDRIERLVNLVGELVINQAMLSQGLENAGLSPHSDAMNGLEEFQRLTRDIQDSVMMIRAQPVKSLFQRMSRIVRETSALIDKDVRLQTFGEDTEVDKTVIERLADPLTHMVRNAVDHGLEPPQERLAAGKPAQGRITLTASHRSGRMMIEISDDGSGINRAKVLASAIAKGLVPPDASLSDGEIDNLLFLPGFSTASEISDLSGRGVGMDVVRTAIQALGGRIATNSDPGVGTTFSISLPLTLAVLDGMVIQVAGETLVVPLNLVVETLTLDHGDVAVIPGGRDVIQVRSGFVPLFDLGAALGYRAPVENYKDAVVLMIAQESGEQMALLIDNIQDQRQVVIKGLDDGCFRAPGIAAATILGNGQIALILDPADIVFDTPSLALPQNNVVASGAVV